MPASDSEDHGAKDTRPLNSNGWDGKLRVGELGGSGQKHAVLANPEALSDPEYSDPEAPPADVIDADEDLLDGYEPDSEDIDLVHCRIGAIPALHLERFPKAERICLRQNQISSISLPDSPASNLKELDLYDNLISHMRGLDNLSPENLETLDLSFNKIKHIKNVSHLKNLKNLYLVQNKISKIEGLDGLTKLKMLELAANRLREIENLDSLTSLEELWLGKNKITEIKNISALTNLRILSMPSNRLTSLDALPSLPELTDLYVSHNMITSMKSLLLPSGEAKTPNLRVLDVTANQIPSLSGIGPLKLIEEFWASDNQFDDWAEIERELADKEGLVTVYFEGNPLQKRQMATYRNKVRLTLPRVKQIDATYVRV